MKTLDKNLQKIVTKYRNDLQKFVTKNNLDADMLDDIYARVDEKIEARENPTRSDILSILSSIGTPEEIFAEEIAENTIANSSNIKKPENFLKRFQNATDKIIFLGVFYTLSELTLIPANIFRALFLFLVIIGVLVAGKILPILLVLYFLGFLLLRTRFFGFLFSFGMGVFVLLVLIPATMLFGMYLSDFHIENMYPFMGISPLFPIGMILGIFSLILFVLYFFRYAFTKKWFGVGFLVTAIVSFVSAISFGVVLILGIFSQLSLINTVISEKEFSLEVPASLDVLDIHSLSPEYFPGQYENNIFGIRLWNARTLYTDMGLSPDDKIHIFVEEKVYGIKGGEGAHKLENIVFDKNNFLTLDVRAIEWRFPIAEKTFNITKILIPAHIKFLNHNWLGPFLQKNWNNISFPEMEKYTEIERNTIASFCGTYFYDSDKNLHCDIDSAAIQNILKDYSGVFLED